jgi:CheY-like chemotaxis protein
LSVRVPDTETPLEGVPMVARIVVLVVEDEPLVRMDIAEHLVDEGFEVFEAGNADEAIAIL